MGSDATGPLVPTGYLPRDLRAIEVNIIYMYRYIEIYIYINVHLADDGLFASYYVVLPGG